MPPALPSKKLGFIKQQHDENTSVETRKSEDIVHIGDIAFNGEIAFKMINNMERKAIKAC